MAESFESFITKNRFKVWDILNPREMSVEDYNLSRCFDGMQFLFLTTKHDELRRLGVAIILADHMAGCEMDRPALFSKFVSYLRDDEWSFALKFCPYHKIEVAVNNLKFVQLAMNEACIGISSAKSAMETAFTQGSKGNVLYEREQSKATVQLLNFSALYASYVDMCWRIRDYCKLKKSKPYADAVNRLISKNIGPHSFFKDLRNFMLHYHIQAPVVTITYSEHTYSTIELNSSEMLYSGFEWKPSSREFLRSRGKVDLLEAATTVVRDAAKVISFHEFIVKRKFTDESYAYKYYITERNKYNHLKKSMTNINAAFGIKSTLLDRLSTSDLAKDMASTSISDEELRSLILSHANRYANLPQKIIDAINEEIEQVIATRPRYPAGGAYLGLRRYE